MESVLVELGERSYTITIGTDLLCDAVLVSRLFERKQLLIVTNESIAPLHLERVLESIRTHCSNTQKLDSLILPDGERFKHLDTLMLIYDALIEKRFDRGTCIVALGGGVVGDMVGFAAATYQRGVAFIQIPTTVLAQVDSSVGGKTGVNHPLGKNMIGAFHQPQSVLIDLKYLDTLPAREVAAGIAEIIKYGLIYDQEFYCWLESNIDKLIAREFEPFVFAVKRSCEIKASVVASDETEAGVRAILNLGHTYGHAIEAKMGYGYWLHGEAVAVGMCMAVDFSVRLGWLDKSWLKRAKALFEKANLPTQVPESMTALMFKEGMAVDKKVSGGKLRLVLLKDCGKAVVTSDFDMTMLDEQLAELCSA